MNQISSPLIQEKSNEGNSEHYEHQVVEIIEAVLPNTPEYPKVDHTYEYEHVERHDE